MSQENVEMFGRLPDAFNARDIDGFLDECDPEIELHLDRVIDVETSAPASPASE